MKHEKTSYVTREECSLIIQQEGKPQQLLANFVQLLLNYQYGLRLLRAHDPEEASELLLEHSRDVRCVFVIQRQPLPQRVGMALNKHGTLPFFLVLPEKELGPQREVYAGIGEVFFCSWEKAFTQSQEGLQHVVRKALDEHGIGDLFQGIGKIPHALVQQRVGMRLKNIKTLPTLSEIIMRIMRLVKDPQTTTEQLEQVLCTDPAIVMKLLQVVKSPIFAGTGHQGNWTLTDIIVRLGLKKVGAIAQQIKIINSLIKPGESEFDLRRFWEHSVGSAIIADKLYTRKLLPLKSPIEFNAYWIGALLHDIGKLVLGFFFRDWFARVLAQSGSNGSTFRQAEAQLCESVNHEHLGRLLLMYIDVDEELSHAVGKHHSPEEESSDLACLIHLADNLCKDLGLGYLEDDHGEYSEVVFRQLGIQGKEIEGLKESLGEETVEEIRAMVKKCL